MASTDVRGVTRAPTAQVWGPLVFIWILWGSTYLGTAVMVRSVPPLLGSGIRFLLATVVLAVILAVVRGPRSLRITRGQVRGTATMGIGMLGVGIGTLALAERYVPSGIAALIVAVTPLFIIVFRMRAGDRVSAFTLIGVAVGMVGLAVMLLPGGTVPIAGTDGDVVLWSAAMLVSCFCWGLFSWRASRYDLPANSFVTTLYEMLFAGIALVVVGTVVGERLSLPTITPAGWGSLAFLVAASITGLTAYAWLIQNAPLSLVATYNYVNPVVAVLLGWLVVGEAISRDVIIGLTVVLGGVVLVTVGERRR